MMVWKSSSTRIMSAASLHTSVPVWPMATPMSAAFRATASFTPSPVMATTSPRFWRDCRETLMSGRRRVDGVHVKDKTSAHLDDLQLVSWTGSIEHGDLQTQHEAVNNWP